MDFLADYRNEILAVVLAILSWFAKNNVVAYMTKREEAARKEWEFRLMNIWNPLFFWSGAVLFEPSKKDSEDPKGSYGVKELSNILQQAAHLIPLAHYRTFVRLLEIRTGQKKLQLDLDRLKSARAYVYGQVETHNYILFGRYPWFKVTRETDPLGSVKEALRFFAELLWHLLIWGTIILVLLTMVTLVTEGSVPVLTAVGALGLLLLSLYLYWRFRAHRAVTVRQQLGKAVPPAQQIGQKVAQPPAVKVPQAPTPQATERKPS